MTLAINGAEPAPGHVDRRHVAINAALMTGGFIVGMAGAVGLMMVISGSRRYLASRPEPLYTTARRRYRQLTSAIEAGRSAWLLRGSAKEPSEGSF